MPESTSDRILESQHAITAALPEESRHLLGELDDAHGARFVEAEDLVLRAIFAHLPHRAEEIMGGLRARDPRRPGPDAHGLLPDQAKAPLTHSVTISVTWDR